MSTTIDLVPLQPRPSSHDKLWAVLCHLSGFFGVPFLLPLIVYLVMRGESPFVAAQARETLNFHLSLIIYGLLCLPLTFIVIGIPLLILLGLAGLVFAIIAALKVSEGGSYRYPFTIRLIQGN